MLSLISDHRPCFLFNYLFLQSLPGNIRFALSGQQQQELGQLAQLADTLSLTRTEYSAVHRVDRNSRQKAKIDENKPSQKSGMCFYHQTFWEKRATAFPHAPSRETQRQVIVSVFDDRRFQQNPFL